jgi:hypothetical protein
MVSRSPGLCRGTPVALFCDEVCQITVSGRRACYEDGNVRAGGQGIGDARGGRTTTTLSRAEPDDMSDSTEGNPDALVAGSGRATGGERTGSHSTITW